MALEGKGTCSDRPATGVAPGVLRDHVQGIGMGRCMQWCDMVRPAGIRHDGGMSNRLSLGGSHSPVVRRRCLPGRGGGSSGALDSDRSDRACLPRESGR